jgi:uncharacterized protein (UPF0335 family)
VTNAELKRRAERRVNLMTEIDGLKEELKMLKTEDKADGYNEQALAQCVKELLKGAEFQEEQLQFEMELDTYRTAIGLPVTLETAQRHVREQVSGENFETKLETAYANVSVALGVENTKKSERKKAHA